MACSPPGSSLHGDSPGKNTGVGCHALLRDLPDPGIKPEFLMSPALANGFFITSTTWEALGSEKSPAIGYGTLKRMSK